MPFAPRSVGQRTLVQIGVSMTLVVLLATAATYFLTFSALEARHFAQIRQYNQERARREELRFSAAEDNHANLRQVLLQKLAQVRTPSENEATEQRFDELIERTPDGAWRSRPELGQGEQSTTTWIHKDTTVTPELRRRIVLLHDLCEQFFPAWRTRVQSLYFSGPERFNTGFDPLFPRWVWEIESDWDQSEEEWAKIASLSENPERTSRWTGVTIDPTTGIPIVTLSTPVDFQGRHVATLHHDISLEALVRENLRSDHASMQHFIVREDGMLIAHPEKLEELVKAGGQLSVEKSGDTEFQSLFKAIKLLPNRNTGGYDPKSKLYFALSTLAGPGWLFLTTLPREEIRRDAFGAAQWVLWTGLASLGLMLLIHTFILRREVARPLKHLMDAVERIKNGKPAKARLERDDELGRLGRAFDAMAADVALRDRQLRKANSELEDRVEARTQQLTEANQELSRAKQETLGLLSRERELVQLKSGFVSLVSHEVRTPLGVIQSSADILDRYAERLSKSDRRAHLETIFRSIAHLTELVEGVLMLGKIEDGRLTVKPQDLNLPALCAQIVDEVASATGCQNVVELTCAGDLSGAFGDPDLLRHILSNLLSNAIKYSARPERVELSVRREGTQAILLVVDHGIGISSADQERLFSSFSRGTNVGSRPGTGLGLMIVKRCAEAQGGEVLLKSELSVGTSVTVTLPLFPGLSEQAAPEKLS